MAGQRPRCPARTVRCQELRAFTTDILVNFARANSPPVTVKDQGHHRPSYKYFPKGADIDRYLRYVKCRSRRDNGLPRCYTRIQEPAEVLEVPMFRSEE